MKKEVKHLLFPAILLLMLTAKSQLQGQTSWLTTGNTLSTGNILGSTNNMPLIFASNNTPRVWLLPDGSMTLGSTTLPMAFTLNGTQHVTGAAIIDGGLNVGGNLVTSCISTACLNVTGGVNLTSIIVDSIHANSHISVGGSVIISGIKAIRNNAGSWTVTGTSNSINTDNLFNVDNTLYIQNTPSASGGDINTVINYNNIGNVGIGTNTPALKLEVAGGFRVLDYEGSPPSSSSYMDFTRGDDGNSIDSYGSDLNFNESSKNSTYFYGNVNLNSNLFVGQKSILGTTIASQQPWATLHVGGSVSIAALKNDGSGVKFDGNVSLFFGQEQPNAGPSGKWGIQYVQSGLDNARFNNTSTPQQSGLNFWIPWNPTASNYNGNNILFLSDGGSDGSTVGFVGVGTGNPHKKLTVDQGDILVLGHNSWQNPGDNASVYFGDDHNSISCINNTGLIFNVYSANASSTMTAMTIANNGRVYIGAVPEDISRTNSSPYSLFVGNGIETESLNVALHSDWSDFVFSKGYKLKTLDDLASFIHKNHHLPNVPSAEEVQKDGIDVAKMDAKLLEKIEELTLYILELKDQIDILKNKR